MKNLFKNLMLVAVAAMGFTACEQVNDDVNAGIDENTVTMTFVAEAPESRTSVAINGDVAKYSWSTDDQVGFYYVDVEGTDEKKLTSEKAKISGSTATFKASFVEFDGASAYNIGAFYPSGSWVNHVDTNPFNNVKVKIPAVQALIDGSFDPKADLMMSKPFMGVALSNDTDLALEFSRIAAIGKMNLKLDDMEEGEIINKVLFSFAEGTNFNGPVFLDLENGDYTLATEDTEGTSNYVELSGKLAANADRTAIFFTCFPGEYSGEYTIVVTTDKATYSKTATLSKALSFSAGNVLNFNATVGNREVKEVKVVYTLVTNVADLAVGDKVIIVAKDSDVAMSTTQNGNNRGVVTVTKSDNTIADVDGLQILTLEAGKTSGTFAFNTGSGYLYAASSSKNYLRTEATLSANSSWSITIADRIATVKAQGANTNNWLRYNKSSNIFSCYGSGQLDICIYKGVEAGTDEPEQPGGGDEPEQPGEGGTDEPEQPGEGGSDVAEQLVTFDFTNISGFSSWGNSYAKHTVDYDDATVVFTKASHQTGTITNMPVTKGQPVEIKAKDGATMKAVKFTCKKWSSKSQTITLHYSTNGGTSYTSTGETSTNFSIEHTELPAGTNAVKITFSSSDNQVGIQQADVTFLK